MVFLMGPDFSGLLKFFAVCVGASLVVGGVVTAIVIKFGLGAGFVAALVAAGLGFLAFWLLIGTNGY
jgi:hypothetical protein